MGTGDTVVIDALAPYAREIEQWRARRVAELTAPNGWLTLVGLAWLRPGPNRLGTAPDNDVVLPVGPAHLGTITLADDARAHLRVARGIRARVDDADDAEWAAAGAGGRRWSGSARRASP